jgi:hypothetical protein
MLPETTNGPTSVRILLLARYTQGFQRTYRCVSEFCSLCRGFRTFGSPRLVAYAPEHVKGSAATTSNADVGNALVTFHMFAAGKLTERLPKYDQKITTAL